MKYRKFLLIALVVLLSVGTVYADGLSDIKNHWGREHIEEIIKTGIMKGYPDNTFKPDDNVSVAEFTTAFIKTLGLENVHEGSPDWYSGYVKTAREYDLIRRDEFSNFNNPITRGELSRVVAFGLQLDMSSYRVVTEKKYKGRTMDENYLKDYTEELSKQEILSGYEDGSLGEDNKVTRAELATILLKIKNKDLDLTHNKIKDLSNEREVPGRLHDYKMKGEWVENHTTEYMKDFMESVHNINYKEPNKNEMKTKYFMQYPLIEGSKETRAEDWVKNHIKDVKDNKIVKVAKLLTDEGLSYADENYDTWARGTLLFKYESHNNPPEGIEVGKWYEQDFETLWGISNEGNTKWELNDFVVDEVKELSKPKQIKTMR